MFNWTLFFSQIPRLILQSVLTIYFSRLIPPAQFGVFALCIAILAGFEVLREFGLQQTSIAYGSMSNLQLSSLFWFRCIVAIFWTLILLLIWIILCVINVSDEILFTLPLILPIIFINTIQNFTSSFLFQKHRFKLMVVSDFSGILIGAFVSLYLISSSQFRYALPVGFVTTSVVVTVIRWLALGWKPKISYDRVFIAKLKEMNKISGPMLILNYASKNFDTLSLSVFVNSNSLGYYNRGFQLIEVPLHQLISATNDQVLKNSEDTLSRSKLLYLFSQSIRILVPIAFGLVFLAIHANILVPFLLGDQWNPSIPIIQLLSIGGLFQTLSAFGIWTYISKGIQKEYYNVFKKIQIMKILLLSLGSTQGTLGAASGYLMGHLATYIFVSYGLRNRFGGFARNILWNQLAMVSLLVFSCSVGAYISWMLNISKLEKTLVAFLISSLISCTCLFLGYKFKICDWNRFGRCMTRPYNDKRGIT